MYYEYAKWNGNLFDPEMEFKYLTHPEKVNIPYNYIGTAVRVKEWVKE
jgi:hypothetical protein